MNTDDNDFEYEYDDNEFNNDNVSNNNIEINNNINNNADVDENFYSYDDFNDNVNNDNPGEKKQGNKRKIIIFVIILLLFLISIGVIIFFLGRDNNGGNNEIPKPIPIPSITLSSSKFSLTVGSSKNITYTIENDNGNVVVTWSSSDKKIATVSETGTVKGVKAGSVVITASYTINGVEYKETCSVTVKKKESSSGGSTGGSSGTTTPVKDTTKPTLSYSLTSGKENIWVNTDVSIKVSASDNSGSVTVKYTTNCNSDCKYTTVSNNIIKISSTGSNVVRIVATDKAGNSTEKKVTVMIDKTKPTCSLKVSETGNLFATYNDTGSNILYYGFSSSYSGTSGNSQTVSSPATYTYYVKDKAGNTNTCSLAVKMKTQYSYQDCISCKTCQAAGCDSQVWSWVKKGDTTTVSSSCSSSSEIVKGEKKYTGCRATSGNSTGTCSFTCSSFYEKVWKCNTYKPSCDSCGGCNNWGEFSAWSDTKYTQTASRNVKTKNVFYS